MAEPGAPDQLPRATVLPPRRFRVSIVWVIPFIAIVAALSLAVQRILSEGPTITIVFRSADGIEAGKTVIKYKDVKIGQVTAVQLTRDYRMVEVKAKIARREGGLMVDDAKFWIVEPRITPRGVSGLNTLLSGNYIGFKPGQSRRAQHHFTGLDVAPPVTDRPGRPFVLRAEDLGGLGIGAPVYYRHMFAGVVSGYALESDGKSVRVSVFVHAPYDRFVTTATRFWNAGGIDASFGPNGVDVRTESLAAMLAGGVAFETPPFLQQAQPAAPDAVFPLYRDRQRAMTVGEPGARQYVLHFERTLAGLDVGAPVTLLGLPAGEVTAVALALDPAARLHPQVTITFNPRRVIADATRAPEEHGQTLLRRLVEERGLRAQLERSLLTGKSSIDFAFVPGARPTTVDLTRAIPELPVAPGRRGDLESSLADVMKSVGRLPLASIGDGLDEALQQARRLMSDVLAPQLHSTLQEVAGAARSLRSLADYLERHPESLLRGKRGGGGGK